MARDPWERFCNEVAALRRAGLMSPVLYKQLENHAEVLYNRGLISDAQVEQFGEAIMDPEDRAVINAIAYGLARLFHTPINQLAAEAAFLAACPR